MNNTTLWVVVLAALALSLGAFVWAFQFWRAKQIRDGESEDESRLYDFIENVLLLLMREVKEQMHKIPLSYVDAVARAVYRRYIANTKLAGFVTEDQFVYLVSKRWQEIAVVEGLVATSLQSAMLAGIPATAPPG